jgi:hypothetical protein
MKHFGCSGFGGFREAAGIGFSKRGSQTYKRSVVPTKFSVNSSKCQFESEARTDREADPML